MNKAFHLFVMLFAVVCFAACYSDGEIKHIDREEHPVTPDSIIRIDTLDCGQIISLDNKEAIIVVLLEKRFAFATANGIPGTYDEAVSQCKDGWRLPTEEEFGALGKMTATIDEEGYKWRFGNNEIVFPTTKSDSTQTNIDYYWCADTKMDQAYCICLYTGTSTHVLSQIKLKDNVFNVRLIHDLPDDFVVE